MLSHVVLIWHLMGVRLASTQVVHQLGHVCRHQPVPWYRCRATHMVGGTGGHVCAEAQLEHPQQRPALGCFECHHPDVDLQVRLVPTWACVGPCVYRHCILFSGGGGPAPDVAHMGADRVQIWVPNTQIWVLRGSAWHFQFFHGR